MVVKTELCNFSEWKIYPGKGVRFVAKDGRPFLFLSKRNRNFGLRYALHHAGSSRLRGYAGLPPGEGFIRKSSKAMLASKRRRESSNKREPSKV
jgi:ribosomal protein L24E